MQRNAWHDSEDKSTYSELPVSETDDPAVLSIWHWLNSNENKNDCTYTRYTFPFSYLNYSRSKLTIDETSFSNKYTNRRTQWPTHTHPTNMSNKKKYVHYTRCQIIREFTYLSIFNSILFGIKEILPECWWYFLSHYIKLISCSAQV